MLNRDDELILMTQQSLIYDIIKNFLKSDLAIEGRLTGINVHIENGYVNAEWSFGDRKPKDIIE